MQAFTYRIYWDDYSINTYLYGSNIQYEKGRKVLFENPMMPSGQIIKEWYSSVNFQAKRIEPRLPLLEEGRTYQLKANLTVEPENTVFIRLNFYDRQKTQIGFHLQDSLEDTFVFPKGTYTYSLQLVQGGSTRLHFDHIEIIPGDMQEEAEENGRDTE